MRSPPSGAHLRLAAQGKSTKRGNEEGQRTGQVLINALIVHVDLMKKHDLSGLSQPRGEQNAYSDEVSRGTKPMRFT
jgi:hypothetical protein